MLQKNQFEPVVNQGIRKKSKGKVFNLIFYFKFKTKQIERRGIYLFKFLWQIKSLRIVCYQTTKANQLI